MNICLISREYPPDTAWGGIGTYTYNLAQGLVAQGQQVHVICQSLDVDRESMDRGVFVHRVAHKSFFPFKGKLREFGLRWEYSQSVYDTLVRVIERHNLDIVEAPNLSGEGFIYSFHKKTPLVTRLHTHFSEVMHFLNWPKTLDRRLSCWFENIAILRSDLITCSTKAHAHLVAKEIGCNPDKIRIIPLGIPMPTITAGSSPKRNAKSFNVLFVGRLEKRKGIHILIQSIPLVLKEFPHVNFVIIGRDSFVGEEEVAFSGNKERSFKEYLLTLLPREYKSQVQFLGYVSDEELRRYYSECDLFVAPSLYESFGQIYIEAMSYGKPVIGCNNGGVPEVVKDGVMGILVPPEQIGPLAESMKEFLRNTVLVERMGKNARAYVEQFFSRDIMTEKTIDSYLSIMQE
jgi:glycosyltransferase involved in cell wall biosynthesis